MQELGTLPENPAARFTLNKQDGVTPFDCLLDFVQFMELEQGSNAKIDVGSDSGVQREVQTRNARLYYTKRVADTLKAEAMRKAAKEAERQRQIELAEEDRRKRYEIVEHVRKQ